MSVRLYYPEPLPGVPIHSTFHFRHPPAQKGGGLFRDIEYTFFKEAEAPDLASADAVVLVHNFSKPPDEKTASYIRAQADAAQEARKPLFIISSGDFSHDIRFDPRVWVFRHSLYRSTMGPKDISLPTTTEDPPAELLFLREKQEKPLVSFCGMGGFHSTREWVKYHAKNFYYELAAVWKPSLRAQKMGVYWRRAMMDACERSPLVDTNFIVRHSFSGHAKTIELDPAVARREYLETSAHADFVLAPKGDGNYSNRFLKTLAFGRIPVLVDTDTVLPLEDEIAYSRIVVTIPMEQVSDTARLVREFYDRLSPEEWSERQRLAREVFDRYLRQDAFLRYYFNNKLPVHA